MVLYVSLCLSLPLSNLEDAAALHDHLGRFHRTQADHRGRVCQGFSHNKGYHPIAMKKSQAHSNKSYAVTVSRQDESRALAETRGHRLTLNVKKGDGDAGFNAAETLLAALGACILTNVNAIGAKMQLEIHDARIEFEAERQNEPPRLTAIRYRLVLDSPEPRAKLEELHTLCMKWGTVTNTVIKGLAPQGSLVIEDT